jgi:hypothetical protein
MNYNFTNNELKQIKHLITVGLFQAETVDNKQWCLYQLAEIFEVNLSSGDYCDPGSKPECKWLD